MGTVSNLKTQNNGRVAQVLGAVVDVQFDQAFAVNSERADMRQCGSASGTGSGAASGRKHCPLHCDGFNRRLDARRACDGYRQRDYRSRWPGDAWAAL